jgi:hypothetical protein
MSDDLSDETNTNEAAAVVVRNFGSERTHLMRPTSISHAVVFGKDYRRPDDGPALCGVRITDGVVMRDGSNLKCPTCRYAAASSETPR